MSEATPAEGEKDASATRGAWVYAGLVFVLTVYVALCAVQWDNHPSTDAWEHHAAILALAHDLSDPGNPSFATDDPSIRYSPYSVALAAISRATGWTPYALLAGGAVFNTLLLFGALFLLMRRWGATAVGPALVVVLVALYGGAPGYAGSHALTDLPWHQLNPSAFAVALALLSFSLFDRLLVAGASFSAASWLGAASAAVLLATVMLSHGMTVLFAGFGLVAVAWVRAPDRARAAAWLAGISVAATGLGLLWPWYDLASAILERPENATWFNPHILQRMLLEWSLPALLVALCALPYRDQPFARIGLVGGGLCYAAGLLAFVVSSASLARMPLAGVLLLHFAAATFVHESGLLDPRSWPGRLRALVGLDLSASRTAWVELVVALSLLYFGVPQLVDVTREPHLARAYLAPVLGKEDKQLDLKSRYDRFLEGTQVRDVVLADALTAWPVPSSGGRVVSAFHWEFFSPDQPARQADVRAFFSQDASVDRPGILDRYQVRWIFLNREVLGDDVFESLLEPEAVVRTDGDWTLMRADAWRRAR